MTGRSGPVTASLLRALSALSDLEQTATLASNAAHSRMLDRYRADGASAHELQQLSSLFSHLAYLATTAHDGLQRRLNPCSIAERSAEVQPLAESSTPNERTI